MVLADSQDRFASWRPSSLAYQTAFGRMIVGNSEDVIAKECLPTFAHAVKLVFTSPPFPLNRKKRYGNKTGDEYIDWLASFGPLLKELLCEDGSIVVEMGNSWEAGLPTMSTLALRALLEFQSRNELYLCQEFIWHNPARLPSPAQWVNVERIRVKDSYTRLWWLASQPFPDSNNTRILQDYSSAMKELLGRKTYNAGKRPSEHNISSTGFLKDNGGAIPSNVLTYANTRSRDPYQIYCREMELPLHPARMPLNLAKFFIKFLSQTGDLILDPFAGSNTTGASAEELGRNWISIEASDEYAQGSKGRFPGLGRKDLFTEMRG